MKIKGVLQTFSIILLALSNHQTACTQNLFPNNVSGRSDKFSLLINVLSKHLKPILSLHEIACHPSSSHICSLLFRTFLAFLHVPSGPVWVVATRVGARAAAISSVQRPGAPVGYWGRVSFREAGRRRAVGGSRGRQSRSAEQAAPTPAGRAA